MRVTLSVIRNSVMGGCGCGSGKTMAGDGHTKPHAYQSSSLNAINVSLSQNQESQSRIAIMNHNHESSSDTHVSVIEATGKIPTILSRYFPALQSRIVNAHTDLKEAQPSSAHLRLACSQSNIQDLHKNHGSLQPTLRPAALNPRLTCPSARKITPALLMACAADVR